MALYNFEVTIEGKVFGEDSYEAMANLEDKIKSGEVLPSEIDISVKENDE